MKWSIRNLQLYQFLRVKEFICSFPGETKLPPGVGFDWSTKSTFNKHFMSSGKSIRIFFRCNRRPKIKRSSLWHGRMLLTLYSGRCNLIESACGKKFTAKQTFFFPLMLLPAHND
jgi:hypothetical protein